MKNRPIKRETITTPPTATSAMMPTRMCLGLSLLISEKGDGGNEGSGEELIVAVSADVAF